MGKIREFFSQLFSFDSISSGLMGFGIGMIVYCFFKYVCGDPFYFLTIFITCIGVLLCILFLGYIINKTLYKRDY